jgi:hypothetical protein
LFTLVVVEVQTEVLILEAVVVEVLLATQEMVVKAVTKLELVKRVLVAVAVEEPQPMLTITTHLAVVVE